MPTYHYACINKKCKATFDYFKKSMSGPALGELDSDVECDQCKGKGGVKIMPDQLDITIAIGEFSDRYEKKDEDHKKRVKCPERARRDRIKRFGSEGVSITKSPHYRKEKKIKAKGGQDIDKKQFIQHAARNPNAVQAAQDAIKRAGKKA